MNEAKTIEVLQLVTIGVLVFIAIRTQPIVNTVNQLQPLIQKLKSTGLLGNGR